jgi:phosphate transport system ATP-binding protein
MTYAQTIEGLIPAEPLVGLEARGVSAWFGTHKVLDRVTLSMEPGTVTALIGPSGCGKSTFLRILNRMHELVHSASLAGQVLLAGEDIYEPKWRPADLRRRFGMVFQKPNPFPAMSIYENVASGLKLAGVKTPDKDGLVEASLRRAGDSGTRSPGGCDLPAARCPEASSSGCASPGPSPSRRTSC